MTSKIWGKISIDSYAGREAGLEVNRSSWNLNRHSTVTELEISTIKDQGPIKKMQGS